MTKRDKYTKTFSVQSLSYMLSAAKIDLNPSYQRDAVWTRPQKQHLIDSLLRRFDIPKIYFRKTNSSGQVEFEVVDGQQRLRSIRDFINNEFPLEKVAPPIDGFQVKAKRFVELATDLQNELLNTNLDCVILQDYSDDDVEDLFLRLQNGTSLNAAEKRRALSGKMREVVKDLSDHKFFSSCCGFSKTRFALEDAAAKVLHQALYTEWKDIRPSSIAATYRLNQDIDEKHDAVRQTKASMSFLEKGFRQEKVNPGLKKYAVLTLTSVTADLLSEYNVGLFPQEFAKAYLRFDEERLANGKLEEDAQDPGFARFTDAARSDSVEDMKYRYDFLLQYFLKTLSGLVPKDNQRHFTPEQRLAIFLRDKKVCQVCDKEVLQEDFHADHKLPHNKGGKTTVENGQLLCADCNLKKGGR